MSIKENEIPGMANLIDRNVNALLHRKKKRREKEILKEKAIDSITAFVGSMFSIYFLFYTALDNLGFGLV